MKMISIKETYNKILKDSKRLLILSEEERKNLQSELLDMYLDLKMGCEKYDIKLAAAGGTALGQVRHGGFIPWDDDFDVSLSRAEYRKFIQIFDQEFGDRYILKAPNYAGGTINRFAQVFKQGSMYETLDMSPNMPRMLYIDVFPLDNVPDSTVHRFFKGIVANVLMGIAGQVAFRQNNDGIIKEAMFESKKGKLQWYMKQTAGFLFSFFSTEHWYNLIDRFICFENNHTRCLSSVTGRKHYFGEMCERKTFFPLKRGTFEGKDIWVYNQERMYLTLLYGDYMKIPDEEDREQHFIVKYGNSAT